MTLSQSNDQTNYILIDKATHEELRKNIDDYKRLIVEYEKVKNDLATLKNDEKLNSERVIYYQKQVVELQEKMVRANNNIFNLTEKLDKANEALRTKTKLYDDLKKLHYRDQARIYAMKKYETRYQVQGVVIGFLIITIVILLGNGN